MRSMKTTEVIVPDYLKPLKDGDEVIIKFTGAKYRVQRVKRKRAQKRIIT